MSLVMRYPQHCKAVSSVAASKEGIEVGLFCCAESRCQCLWVTNLCV